MDTLRVRNHRLPALFPSPPLPYVSDPIDFDIDFSDEPLYSYYRLDLSLDIITSLTGI